MTDNRGTEGKEEEEAGVAEERREETKKEEEAVAKGGAKGTQGPGVTEGGKDGQVERQGSPEERTKEKKEGRQQEEQVSPQEER